MVRDFPKSANQPNKMALTIWHLVSCYCFLLMRDWNWEIMQMTRKFPTFCSELKRGVPLEVVYNFQNRFSGKLLFHLTFNRHFRIFWLNGKHPWLCVNFSSMMLWCDWLVYNSSDWCISILAVPVNCSLYMYVSLLYTGLVVFSDRMHLCSWNFIAPIPVDVIWVKPQCALPLGFSCIFFFE